jgi:hypothetical protein
LANPLGARPGALFRRVPRVRMAVAFAMALGPALLAGVLAPAAGASTAPPVKEWQGAIAALIAPGPGCFTAAYPKVKWVRVACKAAPKGRVEGPRSGSPVAGPMGTVGAGTDFFAHVTGQISSATGSFSVTPTPGQTVKVANNAYSIQMNSPAFPSPLCAGALVPANCYGWEQFVYSTAFGGVEVEFWLIHYNNTCPPAVPSSTNLAPGDCYLNPPLTTLSSRPITDLGAMTLTGIATPGGDEATLTDGGTAWSTHGISDVLGLVKYGSWNGTEFNVFGADNDGNAQFSGVQSIQVTTVLHNGTTTAPTCSTSFSQTTAETNSLYLASAPTLTTQAAPTMSFTETAANPGTTPSCADATGEGDTHLATFNNLFYEFQAQGDFELAGLGKPAPSLAATAQLAPSGFTVQERQISGAPSWPDAAVNKAVAARVGTADVAVCVAPTRLEVNGSPVNLANGARRALPGGALVSRSGSVYVMTDKNGNSVQATVQGGATPHVDLSVGLGRWPEPVYGLLANAGNRVNAVESRQGAVFTAPFTFSGFYGSYGNSWRVSGSQDLLSACNGRTGPVKGSNPTQVFYAANLPTKVASSARAACVAAHVHETALLNACTVDVAVLGKQAVLAYRALPTPAFWGIILAARCAAAASVPAGADGDFVGPAPCPSGRR